MMLALGVPSFFLTLVALSSSRDDKMLDRLAGHRDDASGFCTGEMQMRPDNYFHCLMHFGVRFDAAVAADRYNYRYLDAMRRNVACSRRELLGRRDVLPVVRRLVYDTTNLYLQRVGLAVYDHETMSTDDRQKMSAAAAVVPSIVCGLAAVYMIIIITI